MPTVDRLDVAVYDIPLDAPEADGTLSWSSTTVVTVVVTAGERQGLGFTYGPAACATVVRDLLAPVVLGAEAQDVPAVWSSMVRAIRNSGRPGLASMSIAAVDIALWDLAAKLADLPLCRHLGLARTSVPIYGSGGFTSQSTTELADQLGQWVHGQDIPRVKMKIATGWGSDEQRDLERVRLARRTIGDDAELFVDANGGYTRKQALRLSRPLAELGVTWFEEPVSSDDLVGLHLIRDLTNCDIAAGEYGYDLFYFGRMCDAGAVDVLQADVTRCGGITEWIRIATVAAAYGLEVSGHCAPGLHLHVACAVPNIRHLEYFADHVRAEGILFEGIAIPRDGHLHPDLSRSGHGLDLKDGGTERHLVKRYAAAL
jgi:L-alanine-DL-glutamate epimerase-like enolase superfamily enzyme